MKRKKIIGGIIALMGIICCFIPLFASMGACGTAIDSVCNDCPYGCTDGEEENLTEICNLLGFFVVYLFAFGWVALIFGILGAVCGCCICCGCFKLKETEVTPAGGEVVGQAVGSPEK